MCKVMVNGIWIGTTSQPQQLCKRLRLARQYQDIPFDTSIAWIQQDNRHQLLVNTDAGAFLHPVFVRENLHHLPQLYERYRCSPMMLWNELMNVGAIEFLEREEEETYVVAMRISDLDTDLRATHAQLHPSLMFGICASLIPFPQHNQAPRNMYQSAMGKQAIGIPASNYLTRPDTKMQVLHYPQRPIVSTFTSTLLHQDEAPPMCNVKVGFGIYMGYNQEDSIIINQSSLDRGLFRSTAYQLFKEQEKGTGCATDQDVFRKPDAAAGTLGMQHANYTKLCAEDGMPQVGARVTDGDAIIGKVMLSGVTQKKTKHDVVVRDRSTLWRSIEDGRVDQVTLSTGVMKEELRTARVRIRSERVPEIGDKFSSRHGQKGVCGITLPAEDMPYTLDGVPLDIIVNPHAIPSRMTCAHLMEMLLGKVCALEGQIGDGTPFRYTNIEQIADVMKQYAQGSRYGDEVVYCGITGEPMEERMYVGIISYQRLKHQVRDKVHARARGPVQLLTRQPNEGRSRDGGLRYGEMERDMTVSHGAAAVLEDRMFLQSDKFETVVCSKCGLLAEKGRTQNHRRYNYIVSASDEHYCRNCKTGEHVREIRIPYAFKLFMQEMAGCHVAMRLQVEEDQELIAQC
jgi:DNA-directed RNA polymerase II subunit RPB2